MQRFSPRYLRLRDLDHAFHLLREAPQGEPRSIVPLVEQINSRTLQLVGIAYRRDTSEQFVVPSYGRFDLVLECGEGSYVWNVKWERPQQKIHLQSFPAEKGGVGSG